MNNNSQNSRKLPQIIEDLYHAVKEIDEVKVKNYLDEISQYKIKKQPNLRRGDILKGISDQIPEPLMCTLIASYVTKLNSYSIEELDDKTYQLALLLILCGTHKTETFQEKSIDFQLLAAEKNVTPVLRAFIETTLSSQEAFEYAKNYIPKIYSKTKSNSNFFPTLSSEAESISATSFKPPQLTS